jgi:ABC-type multidrug transport system ATPase subunit
LRDIYLEVEHGELLTILGHNGAGKTTLISIMTGILNATKGDIYVDNMSIKENMSEYRNLIGICP